MVVAYVLFVAIFKRRPFALFDRRIFGLSFSRLNAVFSHGQRPVDPVQLVVESACVAHRFTFVVSAPQRRGSGATICATQSQPSRRGLEHGTQSARGLNKRPIHPVHFVVKAASVA